MSRENILLRSSTSVLLPTHPNLCTMHLVWSRLISCQVKAIPKRDCISPLYFLVKLAVVRVCVDIGFYVGHRALHTRQLYWLHRYHHEHFRPSLGTNFHFHPVDIFVEATLPAFFGLTMLDVLKLPLRQTRAQYGVLSDQQSVWIQDLVF